MEIYNFLIKNDLSNNPSSSRIKAYIKTFNELDIPFENKSIHSVINTACKNSEKIFNKLFYPLAKSTDEIINPAIWNLNDLIGNDKKFLKNDIFQYAFKCVLNSHQKNHDVLVVLEPFKKKPYSENKNYDYLDLIKDRVDIVVLSEIGIVPLYPKDFSNLYPFRYFNYIKDKNAKSPLKYNIKKLEQFIKKFNYKYILFVGTYQSYNQYMHDIYFNISMNCNVNTDWIWSFNDRIWYKIIDVYGDMAHLSYTKHKEFKDLVIRKVDQAFKFTKSYT